MFTVGKEGQLDWLSKHGLETHTQHTGAEVDITDVILILFIIAHNDFPTKQLFIKLFFFYHGGGKQMRKQQAIK